MPETLVQYSNRIRASRGPCVGSERHSYSANVLDALDLGCPGTDVEARLFGLELELVGLARFSRIADRLVGVFGDHPVFLCKSDGSLPSGSGFELVTTPLTYEEAINFVTEVAPRLREFAKSTTACGLHIHTARPHDPEVLGYLGRLISNPDNRTFIDNVAGRRENQWCRREYGVTDNHYAAVSRSHHGTLEFRLFSSTLHRGRLRGAIEFVQASIAYAEYVESLDYAVSRAQRAMLHGDFTTWLRAHPEQNVENLLRVIDRRYPTHLTPAPEAERAMAALEETPVREPYRYPYRDPYGAYAPAPARVSIPVSRPGMSGAQYRYGRENRANATTSLTVVAAAPELLTADNRLNAHRLSSVDRPEYSLGEGGPTNQQVANWIRENARVSGRRAQFSRHAYHTWYHRQCDGRLRSHRGVMRTGQALFDHATYHANRVLEAAGFVRNSRPWRGQYVFEVPATVPNREPYVLTSDRRCNERVNSDGLWECSLPAQHAGACQGYTGHDLTSTPDPEHLGPGVYAQCDAAHGYGGMTYQCSLRRDHDGVHTHYTNGWRRAEVAWGDPTTRSRTDTGIHIPVGVPGDIANLMIGEHRRPGGEEFSIARILENRHGSIGRCVCNHLWIDHSGTRCPANRDEAQDGLGNSTTRRFVPNDSARFRTIAEQQPGYFMPETLVYFGLTSPART